MPLKNMAKKIAIYDKSNNLIFISDLNFNDFCNDNDLPCKQFKKSYQNNGEALYENLSNASKNALNRFNQLLYMFKYKGWYAKEVD